MNVYALSSRGFISHIIIYGDVRREGRESSILEGRMVPGWPRREQAAKCPHSKSAAYIQIRLAIGCPIKERKRLPISGAERILMPRCALCAT